MVMNLWRRLIPPLSRQWCRAAVLRPPPPQKWRNLEEDEERRRGETQRERERRTTCIKIHTRDFRRTNGNFQIKTGCVWLIDIFIGGKWSLQSFNHLNKRPIISINPKLTTQESYKKVPTVTDHAGFVSVELDNFCYFGAELNFFVKLRRTISSYYINNEKKKPSLFISWWVGYWQRGETGIIFCILRQSSPSCLYPEMVRESAWCVTRWNYRSYYCSVRLSMNNHFGWWPFFLEIQRNQRDKKKSHHIMFSTLKSLVKREQLNNFLKLRVTYQVTHILLWFGDVELHLVFDQEL